MNIETRIRQAAISGLYQGIEEEFGEIIDNCMYDGMVSFQLSDLSWVRIRYQIDVHQPPDLVDTKVAP